MNMANPDDYLYEYALIRYVPRLDRGEFMNVGLIMMCKRRKWIRTELRLNEGRLRALDRRIDLPRLQQQLQIFTLPSVPFPDQPVEERYRWLTSAKSAVIQTSPSHPGLAVAEMSPATSADDPLAPLEVTFERLMQELVDY